MKKKFSRYTPAQEQLIRDHYHTMTGPKLAALIGVKPCALYKKAELLGLRKTTKRHGEPYLYEIDGRRYWAVNRQGRSILLHRIKWEERHGPIPEGQHLRCRGAYDNPDPSNWELVTKGQHARLNHDPVKAGKAIKAKWDKAKRWEAMGLKVGFTKYTGKRKKTHTKSIQTEPAKYVTF